MKKHTRREFIQQSALTLGTLTLAGLSPSCSKKQTPADMSWNGFKYAMCNESMQSLSWQEQCQITADAGFPGIEIAPFTLVQQSVAELSASKRREMRTIMQDSGLQCAGLHWLLAPPPQDLHFTSPDKNTRDIAVAYLLELITFCADLGGEVMVFGSPKQRNALGIAIDDAKKNFIEGLARVADHSKQHNVKILIEALDKSQCDVVNTLAEALQIVKAVNHPAIQLMFDFHNTPDEIQPFDELVKQYYSYINHIHVQEMNGKHPGAGSAVTDYAKTFQLLKERNYKGWISVEAFDFTPGGQTIARESMQALQTIEHQLL